MKADKFTLIFFTFRNLPRFITLTSCLPMIRLKKKIRSLRFYLCITLISTLLLAAFPSIVLLLAMGLDSP